MSRTGRVGVGVIGAGVIRGQYLDNLTAFPDLYSTKTCLAVRANSLPAKCATLFGDVNLIATYPREL